MAQIVLATLNARYGHASLALRYLYANLAELAERAEICEFTIAERPVDIVESLLAGSPRIVGLGVYIWNASQSLEVVRLLKAVAPEVVVVLGGPEVSHEPAEQEIVARADYLVAGEGETGFRELAEQLLAGRRPAQKVLTTPLPDVKTLASPYAHYDGADIAHRFIYVEASRGCPFSCEFCLSSLDQQVRTFPLENFLAEIASLIGRGARNFKFIDRTFNLNIRTAERILRFFLERPESDLFLHFEMVPDRFPEALRALVARFAPGAVQFEVGLQTFNREVAARIQRDYDVQQAEENLRYLREQTAVHIHADLIAGLPGETLASFGEGFDRLLTLRPQEIQVGILKRLRGTPISRHDQAYGVVFNASPPYEILRNDLISFNDFQRIKRFARLWDLVHNSGNFVHTAPLIWQGQPAFAAFMTFADWCYEQIGQFVGIGLERLAQLLFRYLDSDAAAAAIEADYQRKRRGRPTWLAGSTDGRRRVRRSQLGERQRRHTGNDASDGPCSKA
ncbi:MAG: DUF4080 domain-containing protein [Deltaproteobacteria bacterium]|nr:DUF4080 domain-containing protein [Deltaproteobacteria bacterium]